jgi:uncharacterized protein involved in exopolysaccharide biosynthesis
MVGNGQLIVFKARSERPEEAAALANVWADLVAAQLNLLYGLEADTTLLEAEVAEAKTSLDAADEALTAFRREYGLEGAGVSELVLREAAISGELTLSEGTEFGHTVGIARKLESRNRLLSEYEVQADRVEQLLQEAKSVQAQADGATSPAVVSGLLADLVQLGVMGDEPRVQLQVNLAGLDAEESLDALVMVLETKQASINEMVRRLTEEVEGLQSEVADRQQEMEQLLREQELAEDTHQVLARKLAEVRFEVDGDAAQVLSQARAPRKPVAPRRLYNTAIAGVLGGMLAVLGVFFADYWRQEPEEKPDRKAEAMPQG